jgi:molecular chaperone GrpE
MDEKSDYKKPLRHTFDKEKDILNTYKKNEGQKVKNIDEETKKSEEMHNLQADEQITVENNIQEANKEIIEELSNIALDKITEIEELKKERDFLKDQLVRKVAEIENQRKRHLKEKQELIEYANEQLLSKMIELLDYFEQAVDASNKTTDIESLRTGLEMLYQKAVKLFEEHGVKKMDDPTGKPFDVNLHDAIMAMNSDLEEGTVLQVAQPGYYLKDKVLRHAKVITSNGQQAE